MARGLGIRSQVRTALWWRYRVRFSLLYLTWSFVPSYRPRFAPTDNSTSHSAVCTASLFPSDLPVVAPPHEAVLPIGATPVSSLAQAEPPGSSPLTAAYVSGDPSPSPVVSHTPVPVKGSTKRDDNTSVEWSATPALSEQPVAESSRADPDEGGKEGRHRVRDAARDRHKVRRPTAEREMSSSVNAPTCPTMPSPPPAGPRFTPFAYTILAMHAIFLLECLVVYLEASPALLYLPSSLPPPFTAGSSLRPPSFAKRFSRLRWRLRAVWAECGLEITCWTAAMLAFVGMCLTWRGNGAEGWNAVLGPHTWAAELRLTEGFEASKEAARGWAPLRNLLVLELAALFCTLVHCILPVPIALGLLSASVRVPSYVHPPPPSLNPRRPFPYNPCNPPILTIPLLDLTRHYLTGSVFTLLSLAQHLQLVLARLPSHRALRFSTFLWCWIVVGQVTGCVDAKDAVASHLDRVRELALTFPPGNDPEWTCTICLEGETGVAAAEEPRCGSGRRGRDEADGRRTIGAGTVCTLPCRHSFHAHCLASWFTRAAFCPTCHADARPRSEQLGDAERYAPALRVRYDALQARLRAQAQLQAQARVDEFPGARAAAGREGRRRRTVVPFRSGEEIPEGEGEWEDVE